MSASVWVHPQFDPVAFAVGPLSVRWYGLMYLIGFGLLWLAGRHAIKTRPHVRMTAVQLDDLFFYGILGVILGGRLGYVLFYKFGDYLAAPWKIFYVWEGGMSFHGGFIGVVAAMFWYARARKLDWLTITDFIAPLVPLYPRADVLHVCQNRQREKAWLRENGFPHVGYAEALDGDIAAAVAKSVTRRESDAGIVIDGAGLGSTIAANKVDGIRAAMCLNQTLARYARQHNGANVLALGSTLVTIDEARTIVDTFIDTPMTEARYIRRLAKVAQLERE